MRKHLTLTLLLGLCIQHCLSQTLVPGIAVGSKGAVVAGTTSITMNFQNDPDVNWHDQKYVPSLTPGYMLSKLVIWQRNADQSSKVELTYTDPNGGPDILQILGGVKDANDNPYTAVITQPVAAIDVWMKDSDDLGKEHKLIGFYLQLIDGTTMSVGQITTSENQFRTNTQLRMVGMKCVFHKDGGNSLTNNDKSYGCEPYIETCQSPDKPFDAKTISDMTFTIKVPADPATTQDANLTQQGGVIGCGPRTYTLSPAYAFLTRTGNVPNGSMTGNLLTLTTTNPAHAGTWPVTMTVTLVNYPTITTTKTFNVNIICQVSTMVFDQASPISQTLIVGITSQPVTITYTVTKTPLCLLAPTFTLASGPAFVTNTPSGNGGSLSVNGVTVTHANVPTGSQLYTMTLTSTQDIATSITINLTVQCGITALTVSQRAADASIVVNTGSAQTLSLDITQTQACQYPFTYTHSVTKNGTGISQPAWLTFDNTTRKFTYAPTANADIGVYVITTTSTIPNIAGVTQVTSQITSFTLTVDNDCTITTLTSQALATMTATVSVASDSQSVAFWDQIATGRGDINYCGPRTYSLSPAHTFLSITGTTLTLSSTNPAEVGSYPVTLTISLTNWPLRPSIQETFTANIICQIVTMVFDQAQPLAATLIVGIDSQPMTMSYSVTKTPLCLVSPTFTLAGGPTFVTNSPSGNGGSLAVNLVTVAEANLPTGSQLYSMTLTSTQNISATLTINLTIKCGITALTIAQQAADASIVVNTGSASTLPLDITQTQACQYPFTYTHSVTKDGTGITQPAWLTFDNTTRKFTYAPTAPSDIGVYVITTTTSIPFISTVTLVSSKTTSFTLTVISDCTITTLTPQALATMTATVSVASDSQPIIFWDQIATGRGDINYCGPRTYSLSPAHTFLSITGTTLTLSSANPAEVGSYPVTLTISLTNWPLRPSIQETFTANIICIVQSLDFDASTVTSKTITVGVDPFSNSIPYLAVKTPNCSQTPTFTMTPNVLAPFVVNNPAGDGGNNVVTASQANHGTYTLTLDAKIDIATSQTTITLIIIDPCSISTILTIPATLTTIQVTMPSASTQTRTYAISTDKEQFPYPVVCTESAVLAPSMPFISLSPDFQTISVDETQVSLPGHVGTHAFIVTISNILFAAVTPLDVPITVEIDCFVTGFNVLQKPADETLILNQGAFLTLPFDLQRVNECYYAFSYTHAITMDGIGVISWPPAWINYSDATTQYTITLTSPSEVGVYHITTTGSVTNPKTSAQTSTSETFTLTVLSDCVLTAINPTHIYDMTTRVAQTATKQTLAFSDTIADSHSDTSYCGARIFTLSPIYPFLSETVSGVNIVLTLATSDPSVEGYHDVSLTISLVEFPGIPAVTKLFQLHIECEILEADALVIPQSLSQRILIDQPQTQPYKFDVYPQCQIKYTLTPGADYMELDTNLNRIVVDSKNREDKGTYIYSLAVEPNYPSFGKPTSRQFKVTLIDPCDYATIFDQKINNLEVVKQSDAYSQSQVLTWNSWRYDPLEQYKVDCGKLQTNIYLRGTRDPPPTWIKPLDGFLEAEMFRAPQPMNLELSMVVSLKNNPLIFIEKPFNVTLSSFEFQCLLNPTQRYMVGSPPFSFALSFKEIIVGDESDYTRIQEIIIVDKMGQQVSPPPKYLQYIPEGNKFTITTTDDMEPGQFAIGLRLGFAEFPSGIVYCLKQINIIYEPTFIGPPILDQTILISNEWSYIIAKYTDGFGQLANSELELGGAEAFLKYDTESGHLTISVPDAELALKVGEYRAKLTLTDKRGSKKVLEFKINVMSFEKAQTKVQERVVNQKPPKPFIKSLNQYGLIRIGFSRAILIPTFDVYPEFKQEEFFNKTCTNGGICTPKQTPAPENPPQRRELAAMEEAERQAKDIVNSGIVYVNNTYHPIVRLAVVPGEESDVNKLNFTWTCTKMTELYMDLEVTYGYVDVVSFHDSKERIKIDFIGKKYFPAKDDGQLFLEEESFVARYLPMQMDASRGKKLDLIGGAIGEAGTAAVAANMAFNFLLGGALSEMFAAIKKLQIMVHLLVINVRIPANAQVYFSVLLQLVTFNFIDTESTIRRLFNLEDKDEIPPNFYYLGYHSTFFLINIGNLLIGIFYLVSCLLFILFTKPCENKRIKGWRETLSKKMFWNSVLSFFNETLLILSVGCFMQFKKLGFDEFGIGFTSELSLLFGIVIFAFPVLTAYLMFRNKHHLAEDKNLGVWGTLYDTLKFKRPTFAVLTEPSVSQTRVIVMALCFIFIDNQPYFQIFFNIMLVKIIVVLMIGQEVYIDKESQAFQYINEMFILMIIYHMICFADLVPDASTLNMCGWSAVVTLTLCLVLNFGNIILNNCKSNIRKFRTKWLIRKRDNLRKEIKEQVELQRKEEEIAYKEYLAQRQKIEAYMAQARAIMAQSQPQGTHNRKISIDRRLIQQEEEEKEPSQQFSLMYDDFMPPNPMFAESEPPQQILMIEEELPEQESQEETPQHVEAKLKADDRTRRMRDDMLLIQNMARDIVEKHKRNVENDYMSSNLLVRTTDHTQSTTVNPASTLLAPPDQTPSTLLVQQPRDSFEDTDVRLDLIENRPYENKAIKELDKLINQLKQAQINRQASIETDESVEVKMPVNAQTWEHEDDDELGHDASPSYIQKGTLSDLEDTLSQSQRVMKRKRSINETLSSYQQTGKMFNDLWSRQ